MLRPLELENLFPAGRYPDLLVGLAVSDDAAVYRISDDVAVICTLDFFTPVVDDPYDYGAIAAVNAMSDVYAMGGEVAVALNVCGFPDDLPADVITAILRGGADKIAEAGGVLAGGHTVDAPEPFYGLAVVGTVHPERIFTKGGARPGDALILTKPLGVGLITTVLKAGIADPHHVSAAIVSMKQLNREAVRLLRLFEVHACTDVTGFSLLGHGYEVAERSGARLRFYWDRLPFLDGAKEYAEQNLFPGGSCRNRDAYHLWVDFPSDLSEEMQLLLFSPETSGGLLAAVPTTVAEEVSAQFASRGHACYLIGEVVTGSGIEIV